MRGITLEEIAEATKIGTRSLRALEEQDFDKLPGGIFNKGFVRAYSKYLGIDEDQAVADYVTAVNEAQAAGKLSRPEYTTPVAEEADPEKSEPVRVPWGLLIMVALVVVVGFAARSYYAQHGWAKFRREATPPATAKPLRADSAPAVPAPESASANQNQAPSTTGAQPQVIVPAVASPSAEKSPAENPPATSGNSGSVVDGFVVKVRAKENSWVWIKADGKIIMSKLMQANSDREVRAAKEVIVVTGNAAGIELSHNDKLLPSLGEENQKRTVVLTAQGMQQ
jgi:cytoskeleton protein RodZ